MSSDATIACVLDAEGRLLHWSVKVETCTGRPSRELAGRPFVELLHPDDRAQTLAALRSGQPQVLQVRVLGAEAKLVPFELAVQPLASSTRGAEAISVVGRDAEQMARVENELRAIKERYDFAAEVGKVGAWDWNPQTGALVWTDEVFRIFGLPPGSTAPSYEKFQALVHPDDRARLTEAVTASLQNKAPYDIDHRAITADGKVKVCNATGRVTYDASGAPIRMLGTYADVTARYEASEQLRAMKERYDFASEVGKVGAWDWNPQTGELVWTDEVFRIFGLPPGSTAPSYERFQALVHPDDRARLTEAVRASLQEKAPYDIDHRAVTADGKVKVCNATGRVTYDANGAPIRMLGTYADVTARHEAARELRLAKEQAESASRLKTAFLAHMSHELRTPLNSILGFTGLLDRATNLDAEQRKHLAIVRDSGNHLLDLINAVLDMSKIEAGTIEAKPVDFDLRLFLEGIEQTFALKARQRGLSLAFSYAADLPRTVRCDELKLRQCLINLLENSLKYTPEGAIAVRAETLANPSRFRVTVQDTGIGVAPEDRARIFEPFVQSRQTSASVAGTGLGLPITREFARLLGGTLTLLDPGPDQRGSTFVLEVGIEVLESPASAATAHRGQVVGVEAGQPVRRVVVVDDDGPSRLMLATLLRRVGGELLEVKEAADGVEAVAIASAWRPHLVWMDMRMPRMNGYAATRAIRELAATDPRPVIIALTASSFGSEVEDSLKAGCDDFLRKPFQEDKLFVVMERFLGIRFVRGLGATGDAPPAVVPGASLAAQDPAWKEQLVEAIGHLDMERVSTLISALGARNREAAQVAQSYVDGFQYEALLKALQ